MRFEFKIIMKILLVGEESRANELRARLSAATGVEIDYTDGDADEDYKDYDCIFDLNFDDDPSNLSIYAGMRDKPVFVNTVKLSLNEAVYTGNVKARCMLFGFNGLPSFISQSNGR